MKNCIKCGALFEGKYCKECAKARGAEWRAKNPDYYAKNKLKLCEYQAAWSGANKDRVIKYRANGAERKKTYNAAWDAANKDRKKKNNASRYLEKRDAITARNTAYRAAHPDQHCISEQNRRARKRNVGGTLSTDLPIRLFALQKGKCPCCGLPLGDDYHLDHIMPLALGGSNTDDNIQLLRSRCNFQKHASHPIEFMQHRGFLL